ncbi:type I polyketide synthase [Lentzea sp. HUAS12]|uniref:type I polyketide synthase n=1 Tax=Lentzea sp. HUAS12 TaxID=2951806 RepID=UPI00209DDF24|nr:type I polyketide synthase [Lentzea sp. HUAS12]USX53957.1 SDR family NAD(P)-dependent oxidoreductase [Lentzea sp. HUAS12]
MIAITGLACRFPGAVDATAFWELIRTGRSGLTRFTPEQLRAAGVPTDLLSAPGYVPVGGLIEDQDAFDPDAFGLTDAEAALMDPQQRLFLQMCWQALEQAGHGGGVGAGTVGVYAGASHSAYLESNLRGRWDPTGGGVDPVGSLRTAMATHGDYLPLQVAYRLNLTGPAMSITSTCSSSLVAVHAAAQALLAEECDTALAGGVSLIVPQGHGYLHVPDGIYSADGVVRPYSADGSGIVYTQGVGAVVLRRLEDALADGDPVLAVLHGSAVNNDGALKAGFTAPSPRGQARVITEAQAVAGVEPRGIGYLEGHGTATALGDPIEVAALRSVFGPSERPWCGLGSVKATIGHANTAAGIASLIKTVLARSHGVVPPAPHHEPVNPELGLTGSAFHLSGEARPWPEDAEFAGVSSFGIGGTNCHVVLGPAPELPESTPDERPQVLVVSGKTEGAARATARALGEHLPAVTDSAALADLAHTLDAGRTHHEHRISVVCSPGDLGSAASALREARPVETARPRIVFAFPGAGSQYSGMGSVLYRTEPVFAHAVDRCAELLLPLTGHDVRDVVHGRAARVGDAAVGLPALFAVSLGTSALLTSWGVRPDVVLGHSLGEYTAAVVSGGLALHDAARLVAVRCTEVSRAAGGGAMLSVDLADVSSLLAEHPDVDLAALNGPAGTVLSGAADAITALEATAKAAGLRCRRLHVDAALHSRLVEPAVPAVRAAAAHLSLARPEIPVVSTLTGTAVTDELGTADHWARQLRDPVRFSPALREAVGTAPSVLVQVGPGSSLVTLARAHQDLSLIDSVTTLDHDRTGAEAESVRAAVARLWARGADVPLDALRGGRRRRVAAPGYAFQSRRLWIDPPREPQTVPRVPALLQLLRWHQLPPLPHVLPHGHFLLAADADLPAARALGLPSVQDHDPATPVDAVVVLTRPGQDVEAVVLAHADLARRLGGIDVPRLLAVTFGADRVESADEVCPGAASARALTRVLAQEHRGIRWRTLDLPASAGPDVVARTVLAELADLLGTPDERGGDIAWRSGTRWRRDIEPWSVSPAAGATPGPSRAVVSGGLGDVGLVVAERLARRGASVVLTSRRALGDVPDAAKTVDALTAEGLDIRTRTLDASDVDGWAALLAECSPDVVVHAAGAAATARAVPLRDVTSDEVTAHLRGKVGGATALREALSALPESSRPDLVVLMSSAATLVGGIGTGPYAAANAALDAIATGQPRWTSVVWDGWSVGPGGTERDVVLRDALDAATGGRALDLVLNQHFTGTAPSVVAVSRTDLARRRDDAAFTEATGSSQAGTLADPLEQRVAELWTELFGVAITSPDADFFALGGHSLLATGMLAALGQEHGVRLRLADLLGSPTVAGLATLLRTREVAPQAPVVQAVAAEPDSFPLTRVQHAYWIGRDGGYRWGDVPCHFFLEYDCADLDLGRYEDAWNAVIARHPMLRAVVDAQGQARVLHDLPRFRIRTHDLTALSEEDRERRLATLRERVSRKPGPADRWPLFTVQAALLPDHRVRLFLGVDVLICDAASWWVVDRDLHARYTDPSLELAPVGIHPAACVRALEDRRRGPDGERAAAYWRARLAELPTAPAIPVDDTVTTGRFARHRATLEAGRWEQLKRLAAQHRVTPTAVLLTVYADVLADWSGEDSFSVVLTLFDRPDVHPDVANVVGDFTSLVLHAVENAAAGTFADRARRTQHRLFRDLDHREHSALDVLAEKSTAQGGVASVPVVFTSALGLTEVIGADHDPRWIGTKVAALSQTPQTLLDHQVLEEGGELLLQWDVLEPVLPPAQVAAAVSDHVARVRRLADDPASWTDGAAPPVDDADVALLLRQGSTPGRTLFLLHPSGGDVLCYTELSRLVDPGVTVVALTDPGLSGHDAPESVDALAELYLGVLRRHQPHGPYLLGGWSMGGDLAQRVACLLHEAGEHTALLVMLDSNDPTHIVDVPGSPAEADAEVRRRYVASLAGFLGVPLNAGVQPSQDDVDAALRSQGLLRQEASAAERVAVFARHLRGLAAYEPRRLNDPGTRTLVVKAGRKAPVNSGVGMGVDDVPGDPADLGWTALLARPPRTAPVDAHHYSLLRGGALAAIAALVNEELARCERPAP